MSTMRRRRLSRYRRFRCSGCIRCRRTGRRGIAHHHLGARGRGRTPRQRHVEARDLGAWRSDGPCAWRAARLVAHALARAVRSDEFDVLRLRESNGTRACRRFKRTGVWAVRPDEGPSWSMLKRRDHARVESRCPPCRRAAAESHRHTRPSHSRRATKAATPLERARSRVLRQPEMTVGQHRAAGSPRRRRAAERGAHLVRRGDCLSRLGPPRDRGRPLRTRRRSHSERRPLTGHAGFPPAQNDRSALARRDAPDRQFCHDRSPTRSGADFCDYDGNVVMTASGDGELDESISGCL